MFKRILHLKLPVLTVIHLISIESGSYLKEVFVERENATSETEGATLVLLADYHYLQLVGTSRELFNSIHHSKIVCLHICAAIPIVSLDIFGVEAGEVLD